MQFRQMYHGGRFDLLANAFIREILYIVYVHMFVSTYIYHKEEYISLHISNVYRTIYIHNPSHLISITNSFLTRDFVN